MAAPRLRIGIYGGTFDPVHHGHLLLATDAAEALRLDRVLFIPAARNPHKSSAAAAPDDARVRMLEAAVAAHPRFQVDPRELHRPPPSFTIDTVRELQSEIPSADWFLFIGGDQLAALDQWHEAGALQPLVHWVVLQRKDGDGAMPPGATILPRRLDLSSTEVRMRVAKGLPVDYFIPKDVLHFIEKEKLYRAD